MTRFARAHGSKASNKKTYEEATPWEQMKADVETAKKKEKKVLKKKLESNNLLPKELNNVQKKKKKNIVPVLNGDITDNLEKENLKVQNNNEVSTPDLTVVNSETSEKKKNKKLKKAESLTDGSQTELTTEGNSIQEPNKIYEKKLKNKKKLKKLEPQNENKKLVNQTSETTVQDATIVKPNNADRKQRKRKREENPNAPPNKKGKTKKNKGTSLEEKKKDYIIEDGVKYKVGKKGEKKPWFDLPFEENDRMTRYKNFFVRCEDVKELNEFRRSLEAECLDEKLIKNKMLHKERKVHNRLRLELLRAEICKAKGEAKVPLITNSMHKKLKIPKEKPEAGDSPMPPRPKITKKVDFKYEENELMTQFDGYWILRDNLQQLEFISNKKKERIIGDRTDGNTEYTLTEEEELEYSRLMKKEKRRETRLLNLELIRLAPRGKSFKNKKPGKYLGIDYSNMEETVKFDGFYVKKDAADRLSNLREQMTAKGCSQDEIWNVIKNERRKEERYLKNEKKLFCFKCRAVGHLLSSCPEVASGNDKGVEFCFKCGSTEHMARNCPKNKDASYSHATCFICGEVGHISRECPDNPKGLYPNGGCCNECGSVEHLKRDCPDLQKQYEENTVRASRFNFGQEIDALDEDLTEPTEKENLPRKKTPKLIKFD